VVLEEFVKIVIERVQHARSSSSAQTSTSPRNARPASVSCWSSVISPRCSSRLKAYTRRPVALTTVVTGFLIR